jgi:SAM-dependent methyltransferase
MSTALWQGGLRGALQRARREYAYATARRWTLRDVGAFWDTVESYDDINEQFYTYYRRFTNSWTLARPCLTRRDYRLLDIQTRSGNGALFWSQKGVVREAVCADFSQYLLSLARRRLDGANLPVRYVAVESLPLPLAEASFDLVCSYETVEHVCDYDRFVGELARVLAPGGVMIITCPNPSWEWVHWLTAIAGNNHSEGPHRFIGRRALRASFARHGLRILRENMTIVLPFAHRLSVALDAVIERRAPAWFLEACALRQTYILTK